MFCFGHWIILRVGVLNCSCMLLEVASFQGCYRGRHRNNWRCARAVHALCENALIGKGLPPHLFQKSGFRAHLQPPDVTFEHQQSAH